jgi:D-beta-D-heptose 7-phosphate kinase/D-beta-D-heptose 1-phosphate adenosyltransferase
MPTPVPETPAAGPLEWIEAIASVAVLCIGDVMLDRFVYGRVERISPEAPIPVMRVDHETAMAGGAGNVAANLVGLGAACRLIGVAGHDDAGRELCRLLGELPGGPASLPADPNRPTTVKTRYIAAGQQLLRADREVTAAIPADVEQQIVISAGNFMRDCGAVVLSDYAKGVLTPAVIEGVMTAAENLRRPVIVDPKGRDFARYRGAAVLTPNRKELAEATGMAADGDEETERAARKLLAGTGVGAVVVTRGEQGMSVVPADREATHLHGEAREVFDVSGAGDTAVATLTAALAAGATLEDAARLANLAGGIVVGKVGTAIIRAEELAGALRHERLAHGEAKVLEAAAALERVRRWRAEGRRIGFTNGCFDLLHPGHISLMRQARAACDRLVVGLNTDASVRRLKGEGRPVQEEAARAAVLASLADVDLVVPFAEDTPMALIALLRPDVLVKGADYTVDTVVGAELVQGYGGRVLLADLAAGHSTTDTIRRMAR